MKLNNYSTEQDEEYFSSQETDDVFFQKNSERNNGIKEKGEFVRSIVRSITAELFYRLLKQSIKFEWSTKRKNAVTEWKKKLLEAPVLGYSNDRDPYTLTTDASLTGIEAILTQKQGTEDRVIAYASKTLSKNQ